MDGGRSLGHCLPGDCQDDRPAAMEFGISSTPATADTSPTALRTICLGAMTSQPQSTLSPTGWLHYQSQHFTRNKHPKGLPHLRAEQPQVGQEGVNTGST